MLVKGYTDLSVQTPDCRVGVPVWTANFRLDADVTHLFPYINAVVEDAVYHENHSCIIFSLGDRNCSLYPDRVKIVPFLDRDEIVDFIGKLIDFLNDLDSKKDSIEPSFKKYKPPAPVIEIFKLLPKTNCKKCSYATCMAFAAELSQGNAELEQCQDISKPGNENSSILKSLLE